jgi:hypothetical protein
LESLIQELSIELEEVGNLGSLASATRLISTAALHRFADELKSAGKVRLDTSGPAVPDTVHTHSFTPKASAMEAHDRAA